MNAILTCLDQPELVTEMLETLDPVTASAIEMRATAVSMTMFDFVTVTIANAALKTATPVANETYRLDTVASLGSGSIDLK